MKVPRLRQLDLGWREHPHIHCVRDLRKANVLGDPPMVLELAAERRLAGDVSSQANSVRIEAGEISLPLGGAPIVICH